MTIFVEDLKSIYYFNRMVFIKHLTRHLKWTEKCVAGKKMQYESPSQDPRLTVDERLKLLYPMVNIICAHSF